VQRGKRKDAELRSGVFWRKEGNVKTMMEKDEKAIKESINKFWRNEYVRHYPAKLSWQARAALIKGY
jgi:hypothetical protein